VKPDHVADLFERINGGDDVDAAAEAESILRDLLRVVKLMKNKNVRFEIVERKARAAIARAGGRS
jgi:hypothetical protein